MTMVLTGGSSLAHVLRPYTAEVNGAPVKGWQCKDCDEWWEQLPPIPDRLTGCPGVLS